MLSESLGTRPPLSRRKAKRRSDNTSRSSTMRPPEPIGFSKSAERCRSKWKFDWWKGAARLQIKRKSRFQPTHLTHSNAACTTSHAHKTSTTEQQTRIGRQTHGRRKRSPNAIGNRQKHRTGHRTRCEGDTEFRWRHSINPFNPEREPLCFKTTRKNDLTKVQTPDIKVR